MKLSIKKPHIAYFDYFLGMSVGIMYYYYLDVLKYRVYKASYKPFLYLFYNFYFFYTVYIYLVYIYFVAYSLPTYHR